MQFPTTVDRGRKNIYIHIISSYLSIFIIFLKPSRVKKLFFVPGISEIVAAFSSMEFRYDPTFSISCVDAGH